MYIYIYTQPCILIGPRGTSPRSLVLFTFTRLFSLGADPCRGVCVFQLGIITIIITTITLVHQLGLKQTTPLSPLLFQNTKYPLPTSKPHSWAKSPTFSGPPACKAECLAAAAAGMFGASCSERCRLPEPGRAKELRGGSGQAGPVAPGARRPFSGAPRSPHLLEALLAIYLQKGHGRKH